MVGNIGQPRRSPDAPRPETINDALALIMSFGQGDGDFAATLRELRDAAAENQRLIAEAERTIAEADRRLDAVADLERRERDVERRWAKLREIREELERL